MNEFTIEPLGDSAVLIRLGDVIDDRINRTAIALSAALRERALPGTVDVAPAFASVCIRFDIARWSHAAFIAFIDDVWKSLAEIWPSEVDIVDIPVCYDAEFGPDSTLSPHIAASRWRMSSLCI